MKLKLSALAVLLAHAAAHAEVSNHQTSTVGFSGSATVLNLQGVTLREPVSQYNADEVFSLRKWEEFQAGSPEVEITLPKPGVDGLVELVRNDVVLQHTNTSVQDSFEVKASLQTSLMGQKLLAVQTNLTRGNSVFKGVNGYLSVQGSYESASLVLPGGITLPQVPALPDLYWRTAGGSFEALPLTHFSRNDVLSPGLGTFETYGSFSVAFDGAPVEVLVAAGQGVSLSFAELIFSEGNAEWSTDLLRSERVVMSSTTLPALPVPEAHTTVLALVGAGLAWVATRRRRQQ